jgi:TatD-related deoxyribonuclease
LANEVLTESLSRAKEVDAAAVLHTESATPEVMADLSRIAFNARFPKSRLVKHYGGPGALEDPHGIVVSLISSSTNIKIAAKSEFMLETDYLDDPQRPGAVMGPKTVPRKTHKALENNILSEDQVYNIHTRLPDSVYGEFL